MKKVIWGLTVGLLITGCSKQQYVLPEASLSLAPLVTFNTQVDVLLVVDSSPSMSLYQDRLADQSDSLVTELNRLGMDYQIAAIHSDMRTGMNGGKFIGTPAILSQSTPDLLSQLKSRIKLGNTGSDLERGIESMMKAFEPTYLSGEGRGFLRDGAALAIIVLSSEDDWSSNSLSSVKATLDQLKPPFAGGTKAWSLNLIGVPNLASSCSTSSESGYREPGLRWIDLVNYSGGVIEPICDTDLGQAAANVRKRIVQMLTDFPIGRKPLVDTIVITKNGVIIPKNNENGWEYIEDGYIIRFHGSAVPGADDKVTLDYKPAEAT